MERTRRAARTVSCLWWLLSLSLCTPVVFSQAYAPEPMRLAARATSPTVPLGGKGQIVVTFLDRRYQSTANNTRRVLELRQEPALSTGLIQIAGTVDAMPGSREIPISFSATRPGRVFLRVLSRDLAQATVLISVAAVKSFSGLTVFADTQPTPQILIASALQAPANGISPIGFYVSLDDSNSERRVRLDCSSACALEVEGRARSNNTLTVSIPAGGNSGLLQVRSSQAGPLRLSAQVVPGGPQSQTTVSFVEPQPASLGFEEEPLSVPLPAWRVPLTLFIADQDSARLGVLKRTWTVRLETPGDNSIEVDPNEIVLSPETPARDVFLTVRDPSVERAEISARIGDGGWLRTARKKIGFKSRVGRIKIVAPDEADSKRPVHVIALFLDKDRNQEAPTEFPRTVNFVSKSGTFDRASIQVGKGATRAESTFFSDTPGKKAEIDVFTTGVDADHQELLVITGLRYTVLMALLAGIVGGLARFFYYFKETWDVRPRKTETGWNPGLLGNAGFCGVFGVVFLLLLQYGVVHTLTSGHEAGFSAELIHTPAGAFLVGIVGGFVGVGILEIAAERFGLSDALNRREKVKTNAVAATGA